MRHPQGPLETAVPSKRAQATAGLKHYHPDSLPLQGHLKGDAAMATPREAEAGAGGRVGREGHSESQLVVRCP